MQIILYVKNTTNDCNKKILTFLNKNIKNINKVGYVVEIIIVNNKQTINYLEKNGVKMLPTLNCNNKFICGFNECILYMSDLITKKYVPPTSNTNNSNLEKYCFDNITENMTVIGKNKIKFDDPGETDSKEDLQKRFREFKDRPSIGLYSGDKSHPFERKSHNTSSQHQSQSRDDNVSINFQENNTQTKKLMSMTKDSDENDDILAEIIDYGQNINGNNIN